MFFTAQARKRENSKKNSRKDVGCFCMSLTPLVLEFMTKINARQSALSLQITHSFKSLNRKRYVVVFYVSINLIRVIPLLRSEKKISQINSRIVCFIASAPMAFRIRQRKKEDIWEIVQQYYIHIKTVENATNRINCHFAIEKGLYRIFALNSRLEPGMHKKIAFDLPCCMLLLSDDLFPIINSLSFNAP